MPNPTTIPPIDPTAFGARIGATFPNGWAGSSAKITGNAAALFKAWGEGLSFDITSLQYALAATRIQTAIGDALDLAAEDFFDSKLPRLGGESDASYRARILAAMLPAGATRAAVKAAVAAVTGGPVRIIEPWQTSDTGVWDGTTQFWDVDSPQNPLRWTMGREAYQGFIECTLPSQTTIGANPFWGWDAGALFFDEPNGCWIDVIGNGLTPETVYAVINAVRPFGTIAWVKFTAGTGPVYWWDEPGISWDEAGITWGGPVIWNYDGWQNAQ